MKISRRGLAIHHATPLTLAIVALLHGGTAAAQQAPSAPETVEKPVAALNRVEVIGSKIKGVDMESSVPVQTITRAQIEATSATSLDEVLQTMSISGDARSAATGANQISFANLRGIGFGRTLVLVNGHRWVGSSDLNGTADLSSIPLAAVERIDVLKDGGSVLYGADAMVGMINVVLKNAYQGAEIRAFYGNYGSGVGAQKNVQLTMGHSDERFNGLLAFQFNQGDPIHYSDYAISAEKSPTGSGTTNYSDYTPAGNFQLCKGALTAAGGCVASTLADPNGVKTNFITYDPNKTGSAWRTYNRPTDSYNNVGYNNLKTAITQKSVVGNMSYQLTDHMKASLTAQLMDVSASSDLPPQDLNLGAGGSASGASIFISPANYYNPFGVPIGRVRRASTEQGAEHKMYGTQTGAISPTLSGDVDMLGRSFDWEVGAVHGLTRQETRQQNEISVSKLQAALGPSFKDASGNIVCGTPGNVIAGCVPVNLLGAGTITPAMLNYIQINPYPSFTNNFYDHDYFASISSPEIFKLPAGPLGFAGGIERHSVYGKTGRDSNFDNNDVLSTTRGVTSGGYTSTDIYSEFYVPLLKNLPGIKRLDLSLAVRGSKYDGGASVNNKKFGLKWKVTDDLALRGSFSTGYRLDLSGIIQNTQLTTVTVVDPCSFTTNTNGTIASNRYAQLTADQQAQCRAAGVPAGGYDTRGAPTVSQLSTGRQDLGPEKDIFRTLGFVYSPSYVPGLDVTVDYWDVVFKDSIVKPNSNQFILNCLASYGDPRLCPAGWVVRNASGAVTNTRTSALNGPGGERFSGFDVNLRYKAKATSWGRFGFEMNNAIQTRVIDTPAVPTDKVGVFTTGTTSAGAHYRLRSDLSVNWSRAAWGARWGARYYSSQTENCNLVGGPVVGLCNDLGPVQSQTDPNNPATAKYLPFLGGGSANRIGAYTMHDVSVFYAVTPKSRIKLGINNIFDKRPPFQINSGRSYNPAFGIPDRYFTAEYSQKF